MRALVPARAPLVTSWGVLVPWGPGTLGHTSHGVYGGRLKVSCFNFKIP